MFVHGLMCSRLYGFNLQHANHLNSSLHAKCNGQNQLCIEPWEENQERPADVSRILAATGTQSLNVYPSLLLSVVSFGIAVSQLLSDPCHQFGK